MRKLTAAALQLAPAPGPLSPSVIKRNTDRCLELVRECVEHTGAELVVTPESVTTGFGPGCTADELWDLLDQPDTLTRAFSSVATELGVHICIGAYVRGNGEGPSTTRRYSSRPTPACWACTTKRTRSVRNALRTAGGSHLDPTSRS